MGKTDAWVVSNEIQAATAMVESLKEKGLRAALKNPGDAMRTGPEDQPKAIVMSADVALGEMVLPKLRDNGVQSMVVLTKGTETHTRISQKDVVSFFVFAVGETVDQAVEYVRTAISAAELADRAADSIDKMFERQPRYRRLKSATRIMYKELVDGNPHGQPVQ